MTSLKHIKYYENFDVENQKNKKNIQEIINSYLDCAIWTDEESLEEYNDAMNRETYKMDKEYWDESEIKKLMTNPNLNIHNFDENSIIKTYLDIKKFLNLVGSAVDDIDESDIGHDLWLTRNHHGTGFWDRGYEDTISGILTKASKSLGEVQLYIGDDTKLYIV